MLSNFSEYSLAYLLYYDNIFFSNFNRSIQVFQTTVQSNITTINTIIFKCNIFFLELMLLLSC